MTFFCFIDSDLMSAPHMEPLAADTVDEARREAERLLYAHASGYAAHDFKGDERLLTIRRPRGRRDARH